jgi:1-deoxy-D-xylulose-5-phosphate synthase
MRLESKRRGIERLPNRSENRKNLRQNNMIKSLNIDYSGPIDGRYFGSHQGTKTFTKDKGPKFFT